MSQVVQSLTLIPPTFESFGAGIFLCLMAFWRLTRCIPSFSAAMVVENTFIATYL